MPAEGSANAQFSYLDWASRNTQTLLVPIYPHVAGDQWYVPGQPNPNLPVIKPVVNQPPTPPTPPTRRVPGQRPARRPAYAPNDPAMRGGVFGNDMPPAPMDQQPGMPTPGVGQAAVAVPAGYVVPAGLFSLRS